MSYTLASALQLSVLNYGITMAAASSHENFFESCPASRCSEGGPEIRFPFRFQSSSPSCGAPGMELLCSEQADTILVHPHLGFCKVVSIMYTYRMISVIPIADSKCPLQNIITTNLSTEVYTPYGEEATLISCARELRPKSQVHVAGPISCLSNRSQLSYLISSVQFMNVLPLDCMVVSNGILIPIQFQNTDTNLNETAKGIIAFGEIALRWSVPNITDVCQECEIGRDTVDFTLKLGKHSANIAPTMASAKLRPCFRHFAYSHVKVIAATSSVGTFLVLSIMVAVVLCLALKSKNDEEIHLKVEMS
ncbi:hypothetical protein PR202_ga23705 [Eleusine coracana subsp. coracana]|uniref:RING-type E3 ubiquitin transferase n=1 Tax=Eleusine coracana subsp. coracana TaxID=191504 RepID=A0AAV5D6J3_ELECO|nr:hypothetical protein PR202_ga23705 [Eleusine coracana subsp. coracana]